MHSANKAAFLLVGSQFPPKQFLAKNLAAVNPKPADFVIQFRNSAFFEISHQRSEILNL
jgi:hypothetical protein